MYDIIVAHMVKQDPNPVTLTIRATPEDWKLVRELSKKLGVAQSQIVRLGLRALAVKEGVAA